jgi:hypothetical protein
MLYLEMAPQNQYQPNPYLAYYKGQAGGTLQVFRGSHSQRGYGLGGFFASLFRRALPLLTQGAKVVGRELIRTGVNVASDVLDGEDIKEAAKTRFIHSGKKLARGLVSHVRAQTGGKKRRFDYQIQPIPKYQQLLGPPQCKKQRKVDVFGKC